MPPSDDRIDTWRQRRASRLARLPWLRSTAAGPAQAWYVADELLIVDDQRALAEGVLSDAGHTEVSEAELAPGLRRYRAAGLDVPAAVRAVHSRFRGRRPDAGAGPVAGPNHVFLGTPFYHGGPFGPPEPARAGAGFGEGPADAAVAVIDTGMWADSPVPAGRYAAAPEDLVVETDVDGDGLLDGDVGHANFIAGVLIAHSGRTHVRVLKALDTFGVCTEADLVAALARVDDEVGVVNLSLGGFTPADEPPVGLRVALRNLLSGRDRVVVAAAGNNGNRTNPFWPAAFTSTGETWSDRVVAVAAHDGTGVCDWSNAGPWVTLVAPGEDVTSTYIHHDRFPSGWAVWSGTSFATPRVAAAVAEEIGPDGSAGAALHRVLKAASARRVGPYPGIS
jgi:thermitase